MKANTILFCIIYSNFIVFNCDGYKILGILPTTGHSHHVIFSSFVEELASRGHEVTVINYYPSKKLPNLRQIFLENSYDIEINSNKINMIEILSGTPHSLLIDFYGTYQMAVAFKEMGDYCCEKLMTNQQIRKLVAEGEKFDLVIVEQFVTDCGLALAFKLNAPVIGMTAHMLMPWTYSRIGAPNNPSFVPNHLIATATPPTLWQKVKSIIINLSMNAYFRHVIQKSNQQIVNNVYPEVPDLETLGNNISLVLVNQYFALTGSRLQGANVIEVGGMHVKLATIDDKELQDFLDKSNKGVVFISFGTVAYNLPSDILKQIMTFINITNLNFVWKVDNVNEKIAPKNLLLRKWFPQPAILCHPNVVAFVTHSGMLSTIEAVHCGVPLISVPLFGDQFSNAQAALERGLGVVLDINTLTSQTLGEALNTVLQDRYQSKAKEFSKIWNDRPLSPMDTAVFWTEYVANHQNKFDAKPPTVQLNIIEYFIIDILLILSAACILIIYIFTQIFRFMFRIKTKSIIKKVKRKKN